MKWGSKGKGNVSLQQGHEADGMVFSITGGVAAGGWYAPQPWVAADAPLAAYLDQLFQDGVAIEKGDRLAITWEVVHALLESEEHFGSTNLLGLPEFGDWVPSLGTSGALTDRDFQLAVVGWFSPTMGQAVLQREGALLSRGSDRWLMSAAAWQLLGQVLRFSREQTGLDPDERLRTIGTIRHAALACGAPLDDFLAKTDIRTPDKLRIDLKREDALGLPVVEVMPVLEGVPMDFLDTFDRYDRVRNRYDIVRPDGGLLHVAPGGAVRDVLESVKRMPARRLSVAQSRLFSHNPYAVLGDRAVEALDEEAFQQARKMAGLLPSRMAVVPDASSQDAAAVDFLDGGNDSISERRLLGHAEARELLAAAGVSRASGLPCFHWGGVEVALDHAAERELAYLADWLACAAAAQLHQGAQRRSISRPTRIAWWVSIRRCRRLPTLPIEPTATIGCPATTLASWWPTRRPVRSVASR